MKKLVSAFLIFASFIVVLWIVAWSAKSAHSSEVSKNNLTKYCGVKPVTEYYKVVGHKFKQLRIAKTFRWGNCYIKVFNFKDQLIIKGDIVDGGVSGIDHDGDSYYLRLLFESMIFSRGDKMIFLAERIY